MTTPITTRYRVFVLVSTSPGAHPLPLGGGTYTAEDLAQSLAEAVRKQSATAPDEIYVPIGDSTWVRAGDIRAVWITKQEETTTLDQMVLAALHGGGKTN